MADRSRVPRGKRHALSVLAWPLVCYLGFSLGVPLANGAYAREEFWTHFVVVLLVVAAVMAVWAVSRALWDRITS